MRHNGRPAIQASTIHPHLITLHPGERPTITCPDCDRWRVIRRGMIWPHRKTADSSKPRDRRQSPNDREPRCPGSAQRVVIDLTADQWLAAFQEASRDAGARRPTAVRRKPRTVATPAVMQIRPVTYTQLRGALEVHRLYGCQRCESGRLCDTGRDLRERINNLAQAHLARASR